MLPQRSLQDIFLAALIEEQILVSIFLVNGIKLHGTIVEFDDHVMMLKSAVTQMVYKHAISTVVPSKMMPMENT